MSMSSAAISAGVAGRPMPNVAGVFAGAGVAAAFFAGGVVA
jgi:hypothetical protein